MDANKFKSTPTTPVTWPPPYRGVLTGSYDHGAAGMEDKEAVPGNVPTDIIVTDNSALMCQCCVVSTNVCILSQRREMLTEV